jgi:copper transport protein
VAFEPAFVSISLDFIHLLAASIWSGGLFFILLFWKKHREYVKHFLLIFSKAAFLSIIVLILSGATLTFIYLPDLSYLVKTQWGVLLLIKVGLVFMVILTGAFLRFNLKNKQENSIGKWLKIDMTMMFFILIIVGCFTHLSPLPQNEPLNWTETKNDREIKTMISPKIPGSNSITIDATSLEEGVIIKGIQLFLKYKDNPEVSPLQVPISTFEQDKSVYKRSESIYIPFDGNWTIELRILDSNDDESVFSKDFTVF